MSALPKAIQRQVDQATAAEAAIAQELANPAEVLVTDPSQLVSANADVSAQPQNQAPAPAPAPSDDWQQKYRSLQGMFAQQTGELRSQVKQYESQFAHMQQQLDALSRVKAAEESKPKVAADPNDEEAFGADMVAMVQKYAEQVFRSMSAQFGQSVEALDGRLKALEGAVTGVRENNNRTMEQQFYATLAKLVPDWEAINTDQRWLEWLGEQDPVYGVPRQAALDNAHKSGDVDRVARVFSAFRTAHPTAQKPSLANQVAPNGAAAPVISGVPSKQLLSGKFVEKFYGEVAKGRYTGREAEVARIEAEINQAAAEGRIR